MEIAFGSVNPIVDAATADMLPANVAIKAAIATVTAPLPTFPMVVLSLLIPPGIKNEKKEEKQTKKMREINI